jgi:hypothetical protein
MKPNHIKIIFRVLLALLLAVSLYLTFETLDSKPAPIVSYTPSVSKDIQSAYLSSPYKVIRMISSERSTSILYIVIKKEKDRESMDSCGGIYSAETCYFFLEPTYNADASPLRYLGAWTSGTVAAIGPGTKFVFVDDQNVKFSINGGDGGASTEITENLNLQTGQVIEVERKSYMDGKLIEE